MERQPLSKKTYIILASIIVMLLISCVIIAVNLKESATAAPKATAPQTSSVAGPTPPAPLGQNVTGSVMQDDNYEVNIEGHHFKVSEFGGKETDLRIKLIDDDNQIYDLRDQYFGMVKYVNLQQIASASGEKTVLISAPSGGSGGDIVYHTIGYDSSSKKPVLWGTQPFTTLGNTNFYKLAPYIKDNALTKWVNDEKFGYLTGRFQDIDLKNSDNGNVVFNIGYKPVRVEGTAEVKFNFKRMQFEPIQMKSTQIFDVSMDEIWCADVASSDDPFLGTILKKKVGSGTFDLMSKEFLSIHGCGESLDKQLKNHNYYLLEALKRYKYAPDLLKQMLLFDINTSVTDKDGNTAYAIALASGISDQSILDRLSAQLTKQQIRKSGEKVKLTMHGSTLAIEEIEQLILAGIDVNSDMSEYSVYDEKNKDNDTGTILGSAINNKDFDKVKWLLEHGADPNQKFGQGEFRISPLRRALPDLRLAEVLLQHKANPDEMITGPGFVSSLLTQEGCNVPVTELLKKYGATKEYYSEEGKEYSKQELEAMLTKCKKSEGMKG
jgi:hypothetical protein